MVLSVHFSEKITAANEEDGDEAPSCLGLNDTLISYSNYGTYLPTPRKTRMLGLWKKLELVIHNAHFS